MLTPLALPVAGFDVAWQTCWLARLLKYKLFHINSQSTSLADCIALFNMSYALCHLPNAESRCSYGCSPEFLLSRVLFVSESIIMFIIVDIIIWTRIVIVGARCCCCCCCNFCTRLRLMFERWLTDKLATGKLLVSSCCCYPSTTRVQFTIVVVVFVVVGV